MRTHLTSTRGPSRTSRSSGPSSAARSRTTGNVTASERRNVMRRLRWSLALLALVVALPLLAPPAAAQAPKRGGTLTVGNDEDAVGLDPHLSVAFASSNYFERSEEHTSELQSHVNLVCRLLLEKKK